MGLLAEMPTVLGRLSMNKTRNTTVTTFINASLCGLFGFLLFLGDFIPITGVPLMAIAGAIYGWILEKV